ncbi:DUF2971 domain-containing protein [Aquirufa nivalisilvae]
MDEFQQEVNEIQNFVNEVLNQSFPNWALKSFGTFKKVNSKANTFFGEASKTQIFEGTPYQYIGNHQFLHFTSLISLKAILDCGWLRMSELGNLSDKTEYLYAASNILGGEFSKVDLDSIKETLFCLSACEVSHENNIDPYLWNVYGDQGKGVSIEYEFSNFNIYDYLFGNVLYGIESLDLLKEVLHNFNIYKNSNRGIYPTNFLNLISDILVFHKAGQFKSEKEVRLFWRSEKSSWEKHEKLLIYEDFNTIQEVRYFVKLFLKGRNPYITNVEVSDLKEIEMLDYIPQVEIKKITLGSNISIEKKLKINELLCYLKKKHNYEYSIFHLNTDSEILPFF